MRVVIIIPVNRWLSLTYLFTILIDSNIARDRHHIFNSLIISSEVEHNLAERSHSAAIGRRGNDAILDNGSDIEGDCESVVGLAGEITAVIPSLVTEETLWELEVISTLVCNLLREGDSSGMGLGVERESTLNLSAAEHRVAVDGDILALNHIDLIIEDDRELREALLLVLLRGVGSVGEVGSRWACYDSEGDNSLCVIEA